MPAKLQLWPLVLAAQLLLSTAVRGGQLPVWPAIQLAVSRHAVYRPDG